MSDLRQACDRCHSKKLRCTKIPHSPICTRCTKANTSCTFSPPTRSLRGGGIAQEPCVPSLPFDWSAMMSFDNIPANNVFVTTPPISDRTEPASIPSEADEITQLTDLLAALNVLQREFPLPALNHLSFSQVREFSEDMKVNSDLQLKLEQLLRRTQQLVTLYPLILKIIVEKTEASSLNDDDVCDILDCMHRMRQSLQEQPAPLFDHTVTNTLVATHLRLLDILDNLVNHTKLCAYVVETLPKDHEPQFDIPEIRIGSFVASKGSAASMLVSMMIELKASLTDRSQELLDLVCSLREKAPKEVQILQLQCEALGDRSRATLAELQTLRHRLRKAGLML